MLPMAVPTADRMALGETALSDGDLSGESRSAVESAFQSVKEGHDQMSQLKHGMEA